MDTQFWLARWEQDQIGFHQDQPTPPLVQYWPGLGVPEASRVLVPLAGKSRDMLWLAAQGYRVLGVELSPVAVQKFLAENELQASVHGSPLGTHHVAGRIELLCGDVFGLDDATLAGCGAVFDRAAVIALPQDMRERYVARVYARLPPGCRGLMVTLEYDQSEMEGPPFSVPEHEVRSLLEAEWSVDLLDRHEVLAEQPRFAEQGVTSMTTAVYHLRRHQ